MHESYKYVHPVPKIVDMPYQYIREKQVNFRNTVRRSLRRHTLSLTKNQQPLFSEEEYIKAISGAINLYRRKGYDARVGGSLGKYASLNQTPPNFRSEYGIRDLDLIVVGPYDRTKLDEITQEARKLTGLVKIDVQLHNALLLKEDGKAYISRPGVELEVHRKVFDLYVGKAYGVDLPTFLSETNFHMLAVYGHLRPKDFHNLLSFGRELRNREPNLPEELYEPFHRLYQEKKKRNPLLEKSMGALVWYYSKWVPVRVRAQIVPIIEPVWHAYLHRTKKESK